MVPLLAVSTWLWGWLAIPAILVAAIVSGRAYRYFEMQRLRKVTGMDDFEIMLAFEESAAARFDPMTSNPEKYKAYIDSLPDEPREEE